MYSLFHVPLEKEKIGDLDVFRRTEDAEVRRPPLFGRDEAAPASPIFIRINDDRHTLDIQFRAMFLLSPVLALFVNVFILDNVFMDIGGRRFPTFFNLVMLALFGCMLLEGAHVFLNGFDQFAEKREKWLILADQEISFVEKTWLRIFVSFGERFYVDNFLKSDLDWLEFRALPGKYMAWEMSIKTKSAPETPEPRRFEEPKFHLHSIRFGDLSYESAAALHRLVGDWLPAGVPLRPLYADEAQNSEAAEANRPSAGAD